MKARDVFAEEAHEVQVVATSLLDESVAMNEHQPLLGDRPGTDADVRQHGENNDETFEDVKIEAWTTSALTIAYSRSVTFADTSHCIPGFADILAQSLSHGFLRIPRRPDCDIAFSLCNQCL